MRNDAALRFAQLPLPQKPEELIRYKIDLRKKIIEKAGIIFDHDLPLDIRETGIIQMKGYQIRNIAFQVRPGIYATANLYVPDGKGPFPAVINMLGHWRKGKIDSTGPQAVGHTLASGGYVCLTVDPWGAGERTTVHCDFEYHGGNLGASLMNTGETLLGMQVSDNIRGIDLLSSLKEVDPEKIGATGASGGGNQTMWLSAVDERVKASVPVVSVGTFESYIMQSNCICELLPDGLTLSEEAGVIVLHNAPLLINHSKDSNPTFYPDEMKRTYSNARQAFRMAGVERNISYRIFDLEHGYMREDREAMLGWFNLHLKNEGDGSPVKENSFILLPEEKLLVYQPGSRDKDVVSTDQYCIKRGRELKDAFLQSSGITVSKKKEELKQLLRIDSYYQALSVTRFPEVKGWERVILETSEKRLIPVLLKEPSGRKSGYTVLCNAGGKDSISLSIIKEYTDRGEGLAIVDLKGTGEQRSDLSVSFDYNGQLHTLSRAELWLGRSVMGEWVKEIDLVSEFLLKDQKAKKVTIDGSKDAGLAGLFFCALKGTPEKIILRQSPVSYLFDSRQNLDFYSMGIHIPGILLWGDVSLAAALASKDITFIDPMTMSGRKPNEESMKKYREEFDRVKQMAGSKGFIKFQ
jgi:dienelactone hydrolase